MLVVFEVLSYVAFVTLPDPGISIVDPVFPKPEILLKVKKCYTTSWCNHQGAATITKGDS